MRSSRILAAAALACAFAWAAPAGAQQQASGFAVERLYRSAPGGGWFVMDALDMHEGLGGALAFTMGWSHAPLVVRDGSQRLAVVKDQAFADVGAAVSFGRYRLYIDLENPLVVRGDDGVAAGYQLTAPKIDVGKTPDLLSDVRIGWDARIYGDPGGVFRFGVGAQLWIPNGARSDYVTDDAYRAMVRLLFAGDSGWFTWAAHVGEHVRSLDLGGQPEAPQGAEVLFGGAVGARMLMGHDEGAAFVIGPEVFGATAGAAFFERGATALEALLGARIEGTGGAEAPQVRAKVGVGAGLDPHFGAPEWRAVVGVEMFVPGKKAQPR
ncbi:MAG TPA: hypothetical protein VIF62_09190 [Labilithrix sp.]|jgi:hypothetical protein